MSGIGVLTTEMKIVEMMPMRQSVMRSPRQAAMGGAMLSAKWRYMCTRNMKNVRRTWVKRVLATKKN